MTNFARTVTRSLSFVAGLFVAGAALAENWRYAPGAISGGMSSGRGPAGAEIEVSCTGKADVEMRLYHTGLGKKTVSLALVLDQRPAEKLPLNCNIGECDLKVAEGGAAGLLARLLNAQQVAIHSQLNPDVALKEVDVIKLGSAAKALQNLAADCGISPAS